MKLVRGGSANVSLAKAEGAYPEQTSNFLPGILESSDDLFAAVDSGLRLVAFNAAFRRGLGEVSEMVPQLGQTLGQLLAPFTAVAASVAELCERAFAGEALRLPLEFVVRGDQRRYFDASFSPVRNAAGLAVVVAVALRDVTDKRLTEQKFQAVIEASPDAMLVVREGVIEFANSQLERLFAYGQGSMKGLPLEQLVPERLRARHALHRAAFEREPRTRPIGVGLDLVGLKANGTEFPVEVSLSPLEIGGETLIIAAVRDVSARKQAEDELRNETSELRRQLAMLQRRLDVPSDLEVYRGGFDKAAAALIHYEPDGRIARVNDYFCSLLGYNREELFQLSIQKLTHPDDVQINTELDLKLLAGALERYQIDKRLLRKDQAILWVRLAVSVQRDAGGNPDYLIGVAEDISERKQMEATLRQAQLRLTMATDIAGVGYAELDLDTKATFLSPELKRQLGYGEPEMENSFSEWSRCLHPEDSRRVIAAIQQAIDEPYGRLALEYRLLHKDGSYRWFSGRGVTLEDFPGHAYRLLLTQIDITERKTAEKLVREQAEELQLALRVSRSGTFQWNAQTREHRWYDEMFALYGLKPEEFGGRDEDWLACLLPEDRPIAMSAVDASLKTGEYAADFRIRRRSDGKIRWISARGQVFFDEHGMARRMVGINVDVTEERQVRSELETSKARLEAVLNNLDEGVVIFDSAGQVLDANPAALRILRYEAPEQARRQVGEFADTFEVHEPGGELLPLEEWPLSRVLRGESFSNWELVMRRADDPAAAVVSHNGTPIRDADGRIMLGVLTLVDVTDRKRAEQALQESERRLALALKASNTAVWEIDVATQALLPSEDLLFTMLGYAPGELRTLGDWIARIHEADRPTAAKLLEDVIQGRQEGYFGEELRYGAKDGSWRWILCQMVAAEHDAEGRATRLVGTHTDIHARKQAEERAREASLHDPLTGLPNRALFFEYGSRLLAAAERSHGRAALLFIDLDRFKPINDQYGHEIGDRVLQEVAVRLGDSTRREDLVGRLGGDEFVIMLARTDAGRHRASVVAQHVLDNLSRPFRIDSLDLSITPSIGISHFPAHGDTVEALIRAADLAMYQVKQSGRASYQFYTPDLDQRADELVRLEARIKDAIRRGRLALHYQPVIDVKSGRLIGAEALVRLADDGEPASAATLTAMAESAGLIGELGEWVAYEACRQHLAWRDEEMPVTISINVSPMQFQQRDFPERLARIISDAGVDPDALQLVVTEKTVTESDESVVQTLNRIKSLGVKLALDFGTESSSLGRLSRLPIDKLKVDQSFVRGVVNDAASRAVTDAIIAFGRNLNLDVIGEGIESEDALHYLEEHGCTQAQGFWFSQPLPPSEFAQWYRARS